MLHQWYGDNTWGTGAWVAMMVGMIVVAVSVVVGVVVMVRSTAGGPQPRSTRNPGPAGPPTLRSPTDILNERFARGEIDEDEYRSRRAVLLDRSGK